MKASDYVKKINKLIDESGNPDIEVMTCWWDWSFTDPEEPYFYPKEKSEGHYEKDCIMLDDYRGGL